MSDAPHTPLYQCEATPDCTTPWEFMDEDGAVYCHEHMAQTYGPCGDNCPGTDDCPSHQAWLEFVAGQPA